MMPKQTRAALPPWGLCGSMVPSLLLRVASSWVLDAYSSVLNGISLARSFARGTRAAVQVIGTQLKALKCGWTTVDFVGQVRATNAAPSRAQPHATTAPWLVVRLCAALLLCCLSPHPALTLPQSSYGALDSRSAHSPSLPCAVAPLLSRSAPPVSPLPASASSLLSLTPLRHISLHHAKPE